jgi:uncharacterized membrane protein YhaH (DUF805 family)
MSFLKGLFSFNGCISPKQFWGGTMVPTILFGCIIAIIFTTIVESYTSGQRSIEAVVAGLGPLVIPVLTGFAACFWMTVALYVKRLHDRGKGAIWLLAIYIPPILPIIALIYRQDAIMMASGIATLASLWNFTELGCMGSVKGPNRFTDDPNANPRPTSASDWDAPSASGKSSDLGGMAAAMAAITAAARDNRATGTGHQLTNGAQFGQRAPQSFGRLAPGATGGFGRRGV